MGNLALVRRGKKVPNFILGIRKSRFFFCCYFKSEIFENAGHLQLNPFKLLPWEMKSLARSIIIVASLFNKGLNEVLMNLMRD